MKGNTVKEYIGVGLICIWTIVWALLVLALQEKIGIVIRWSLYIAGIIVIISTLQKAKPKGWKKQKSPGRSGGELDNSRDSNRK